MAKEDMEIVRRLSPAEGTDMKALVANQALADRTWETFFLPDCEWVLAEQEITGLGGAYRGVEAWRSAMSEYLSAFEEYRHVAERFIDAGDCVVVLGREYGRSRTAGIELETEAGTVWWLRGGRVVRVEAYQHHDRALRAAGLRE